MSPKSANYMTAITLYIRSFQRLNEDVGKVRLSAPLSATPVGSAIDAPFDPHKQLNFNPERP